MMNIAVVVAEFNVEVTQGLLMGVKDFFSLEKGISIPNENVFHVPGAFELPLIAQKLAESKRYDGIVCLGAVIKGETAHFEYISMGATQGIMQAMLKTGVPISFGVLTAFNDEQAQSRSLPGRENKGREAALALWRTITLLKNIGN